MQRLTSFEQTHFVRQRISSARSREALTNVCMFYVTLFMTQGPGLQCLEKEARPLVLEKGMSSARASFQTWDKFVTENKQGT